MRLIPIVIALVLVCASTASAQTTWHVYGGGVLGGEEYTRGAFGGSGVSAGSIYAGVDGHALWFTDEGEQLLLRAGGLDSIEYSFAGLDVSFGYVARNATNRIHFIPVGIIGFTSAELDACERYYGRTFCEDATATEVNVGGGFVTAFKGESGRGVHVGFRYTRNYGAAISAGYVWTVD